MPQYLSPGVYVEEVPSGAAPIAGVGTSTAAFIGVFPETVSLPEGVFITVREVIKITKDGDKAFKLGNSPANEAEGSYSVSVGGVADPEATIKNGGTAAKPETTLTIKADSKKDQEIVVEYQTGSFKSVDAGEVKLCTNFTEFKKYFGDFSLDEGQSYLAHAVYGFFNNGGTRCFVVRETTKNNISKSSLVKLEAIDEVALVCAPGIDDKSVKEALMSHCENMGDRFAILDGLRADDFDVNAIQGGLRDSNYAAMYFPWISVFDPNAGGEKIIAPSGHLAGIYARVDTERGVHKAPANAVVRGALGVEHKVSKSKQDGLNPEGINVIRAFNGNITVWGARTLGGDDNGEWKYINVRRLFLFLRESIDEGTQWVVFEPNSPDLWAKITRNITAFLTNVWRAGALFGNSPQEAFYVKCDEETNPPEIRDEGKVVTEIGVAVVKPAEFVIFRISQWAGPSS